MKQTMYNPPAKLSGICVATEDCAWRGSIVQGQVHDENAVVLGGVAGHAGLFSTVTDLCKLAQTMLQRGEMNKSFLSSSTINLMTKNHTPHLPLARAIGWQAYDRKSPAGDLFSEYSYGHTGFTGTSVWMDPKADRFVVLLTNRIHPNRDNEIIMRVRPLFHNLAVKVLSEQL